MTLFESAASLNFPDALSFFRAGYIKGSGCLEMVIMVKNSFSASMVGTGGTFDEYIVWSLSNDRTFW